MAINCNTISLDVWRKIVANDVISTFDVKNLKLVSKSVNKNTKGAIVACYINYPSMLRCNIKTCMMGKSNLQSLCFGEDIRPYLPTPTVLPKLLELNIERYCNFDVIKRISKYKTMRYLSLKRVDDRCFEYLGLCDSISSLVIDIRDTNLQGLELPSGIVELSISTKSIDATIISALMKCTLLKNIQFTETSSVDERSFVELISLKNLREIEFTNCSVYESDVFSDMKELSNVEIVGLKEKKGYDHIISQMSLDSALNLAMGFLL